MTPYQRIMRAAARGIGCRLSAEEVGQLASDDAISRVAMNDDLQDEPERIVLTDRQWAELAARLGKPERMLTDEEIKQAKLEHHRQMFRGPYLPADQR